MKTNSREHASVLSLILLQLSSAIGNAFHPLAGDVESFYSVKVSGNWRIIFQFEGKDAILVDYLNYH